MTNRMNTPYSSQVCVRITSGMKAYSMSGMEIILNLKLLHLLHSERVRVNPGPELLEKHALDSKLVTPLLKISIETYNMVTKNIPL